MSRLILLALLISGMHGAGFAATPYTLDDCYTAALKRSEVIAGQTELITQAEERYRQAKSGLFPTVNATSSYLVQEAPSSTTAITSSPAEQTTSKVTAIQPLFRGMREYAVILKQNLEVTSAISQRFQAAANLYADVATNFYNILSLEQLLRDYDAEIQVYDQRVKDLNYRISIGRSKESEVLTVRSTLDALAAQADVVRGQLLAAREIFAFLTGLDRETSLQESSPLVPKLDPLPNYLSRIEERPDVKSARDILDSVDKDVTIERAGHFPSVDLTGNYYFKRPGISADQHWDLKVEATLPIFAGGLVNARIREAASRARKSELDLARARRLAEEDIRTWYNNIQTDLAQIEKLTRSHDSAVLNYRAQNRDYKLGLVTNIDVLQAITAQEQSKRSLDTARFQSKLNFIRMETAAALRPTLKGKEFIYETK